MSDRIIKRKDLNGLLEPLTNAKQNVILTGASHRLVLDADAMIAAAETDAAAIREAARQDGLEYGLSQVVAMLELAQRTHQQALAAQTSDIAALAVATAEKLVGSALRHRPDETVQSLVQQVLAEASTTQQVVIRVAQPQVDQLRQSAAQWHGALDVDAIRIEPDPSLELGDIILETPAGRVDARLKVQFERLLAALAGETR